MTTSRSVLALAFSVRGGSSSRTRLLGEGRRRRDRRRPRPKVLDGEVRPGERLERLVHLGAGDLVPAGAVAVLQQPLPRCAAALQRPDRDGQRRVGDARLPLDPGLGREEEVQVVAPDRDVVAVERGHPVGAVLLLVLLAAGPEQPEVEHPQGDRDHAVAGEAGRRRSRLTALRNSGSRGTSCWTRSCLALPRVAVQDAW